ncbi:MAG: AraC family transcriptional regulator [Clostridia bacterium]|nr:AraC family transcriptional regulator [Clostridia bacterium]
MNSGENTSYSSKQNSIYIDTKVRTSDFVMTGHHCHKCYELFYVESGTCRFLINDSIHDIHSGDFMLIPPYVLHYTRYPFGTVKRSVLLFNEDDLSDDLISFFPNTTAFLNDYRIFQVPEAYQSRITGCLEKMLQEEKIHDVRSQEMQKILLHEILLLCSRVCTFLSDTPEEIHTTDRQIILAAQYICDHYMNPINTSDIAEAAGFSPNYLSRRFREKTGIGLHEYLVFIRLHHATLDLVSTKDSITQIALRCGFSDSNYFKDAFKKKYGMTPRDYRKIT